MTIVERFQIEPEACAYLGDRPSIIEYAVVREMRGTEYENLMNSGWRKFGPLLFHPICRDCRECRPIRIDAAAFRLNRSQRRNLRDNLDLRTDIEPSAATEERVELYNRYHRWRQTSRGWPETRMSLNEYQALAVNNPIDGCEILVRDGGRLVGVMQLDLTPHVVSDVYHFYDPDYARRGLGTLMILKTIELARAREKTWVYLGYYVKGSRSMEYKKLYHPHEILAVDGTWRLESAARTMPHQASGDSGR